MLLSKSCVYGLRAALYLANQESGTFIPIRSEIRVVEKNLNRIRVQDIDDGKMIQKKIHDLKSLLEAYRTGLIKEG